MFEIILFFWLNWANINADPNIYLDKLELLAHDDFEIREKTRKDLSNTKFVRTIEAGLSHKDIHVRKTSQELIDDLFFQHKIKPVSIVYLIYLSVDLKDKKLYFDKEVALFYYLKYCEKTYDLYDPDLVSVTLFFIADLKRLGYNDEEIQAIMQAMENNRGQAYLYLDVLNRYR